ncbi:nucleoside diphosphate kinase 3 isoform X5 [Phyllostomus discolor]|uniref:nucleoside-diphosphate kinase n=1 Tax=Phyllostomus discolor TaxID=89673 RepID=A0A7E6DCR6_9CHIR|nr:nucleoside diphosphate kinase 3 isoform X5 [Phyllostomus discolor]
MICLVLTIFANLFPAAYSGVHERTFLAVKPDGVQRRLVGEIVRRFERKGFKLVALKLVQVNSEAGVRRRVQGGTGGRGRGRCLGADPLPLQASEELLREHYAELRERPFYNRLVKYMGSGPVVAMILSIGVAGAGRCEHLSGANRGHRSSERPARHCPRRFLYRGT